jgi:hypothetical protein
MKSKKKIEREILLAFDNSNDEIRVPQSNEETTSFTYINIENRLSPLKKAKRTIVKN